jgi:Rrf2 family nitric oxide-sensitive transcriptional repressor
MLLKGGIMRLTQFTDYSLRTLIYVAIRNGEICTIAEVAESYSISKNHLMKVVQRLSQLEILKTCRGKGGGILLNVEPRELNLRQLIEKLEPNNFIVECFDRVNNRCAISPVCRLKKILYEANHSFMQVLEGYTLQDVVKNKRELAQILIGS